MLLIHVLVISLLTFITSNNININNITRVAFLFSGSTRTFIYPSIHYLIKYNLLDSFCPPNTCVYDVFARVSYNDNRHVGKNSSGVFDYADIRLRNQINQSVSILTPIHNKGRLMVKYVDIGSSEESSEMIFNAKMSNNQYKHYIYRTFDRRRYSMYFNRYMSYDMMLNYEKSHNFEYNWVVHSRFDALWGSPIKPHYLWSRSRMYTPDTWFIDIPDTFALMPRNYSDNYYSLEKWLDPKVFCLGGPNFDPNSISISSLWKAYYNIYDIYRIKRESCLYKYSNYNKQKGEGFDWNLAGVSEVFLLRKMSNYRLYIDIEPVALFMTIVRFPLDPIAFYLSPSMVIKIVLPNHYTNVALEGATHITNHHIKTYSTNDSKQCNVLSDELADLNDTKQSQNVERFSCLLNPKNSDHDFMPFRVLSNSKHCLTTLINNYTITSYKCVNYCIKYNSIKHKYIDTQLFHLFPLIESKQRIMQYIVTPTDEFKLCLTVNISISNKYTLEMRNCIKDNDFQYFYVQSTQLLNHTVSIKRLNIYDKINTDKSSKIYNYLTPISAHRIIWYENTNKYCLFIKSNSLSLTKCDIRSDYNKNANVIVLERTRTYGNPYISGITIKNIIKPSI